MDRIAVATTRIGKIYFAVKCAGCDRHMPLVEDSLQTPDDQREENRKSLERKVVSCSMCKTETTIDSRKLYILEIR